MTILQKIAANYKKGNAKTVGVTLIVIGTVIWGFFEAGE